MGNWKLAVLAGAFVAGTGHSTTLTGNVFKSNIQENVTYDLSLGDIANRYDIKGALSTRKGLIKSGLDFSFIKVYRSEQTADGRLFQQSLPNAGNLIVYFRQRKSENLILAGLPITGKFLQGFLDDGIFFDGLTVDNKKSTGVLDYNDLNGHYNAKNASFGDAKITGANGSAVMDYDSYIGKNSMVVNMLFGSLRVEGMINFTDTVSHSKWTDADGEEHESETVTAANGAINLKVTRKDGSEILLAPIATGAPLPSSSEDADVKKLIAFFELFCFDMFSE